MADTVRLDPAGVRAILNSAEVGAAVHATAEAIAAEVRASGTVQRRGIAADVKVRDYVTDRRASAVSIEHAAGLAMQAKHGVLTRNARR